MATLATFRTNIAAELGLDNSVAGDQGLIDGWVNKGRDRVLIDTRCYVTSTTITPGATADYTLSASTLEIVDMYFTSSGTDYALVRVTVPELLALRRNGSGATGPARYYALAGHNTVMFYPTPSASDTLTVYHMPVPSDLSASTDDPSSTTFGGIPVQLHEAIEFYACSRGGSYDDDQSSAQGQRYLDRYDKEIARYRRFLRMRGGRLARAIARGPYSTRLPHDNSTDWRR